MAVETARAARVKPLEVVRAVPVWAWLTALVAISVLARYLTSRNTVAPWIMVDELIYSELAKSFASTGHFLIRGDETGAYGFVYPALLSPAWAAFTSIPDAYVAAKAINALVMSLAAVPAFLLARRVLPPSWSLGAAVLTVSVPPMLYTGMLMTENAFYPALLLAAFAIVAWLERPTLRNTAWVAAACVLAYLTRAQAIALLPVLVTAPLLVSGRRALREFRVLYGVVVGGAILVVLVQVGRGSSIWAIFGAYEAATGSSYSVEEVARWLLYHWAELTMAVGVVPVAALFLMTLRLPSLGRAERAVVATAVTTTFWLVLLVAMFASEQSLRVEERNMFYVVPLLLVCLLLWIQRGAHRPPIPVGVAAAGAVVLPALLPYSKLIGLPAVSDTPGLLPLWSLTDSGLGIGIGDLRTVVTIAAVVIALMFVYLPRRFLLVLPVLLLAYFAVAQKPIDGKWRTASILSLFAGITVPHPDWVDRRVGADADVAVIWTGNTDRYSIWENEFFNRSVRRYYRTAAPLSGDLGEVPLTIDPKSGYMQGPNDAVARARYVLTDGSVALQGSVIARDARKGMLLYRVDGPLRQVSRVEGLYPQDTWSTAQVRYTRLACRGGSVTAQLQNDPGLYSTPNTVTAFVNGKPAGRVVVPLREPRSLRVRLVPVGDTCVVRFLVGRTLVPAEVTKGQNPDPRPLGIHFNAFTYAGP